MIPSLEKSHKISRAQKLAQRLFEGQMLVISATDSKLHRFNTVGTFIWQILEKEMTIKEICGAIADNFDAFDNLHNDEDIFTFILELEKKKLVFISRT